MRFHHLKLDYKIFNLIIFKLKSKSQVGWYIISGITKRFLSIPIR